MLLRKMTDGLIVVAVVIVGLPAAAQAGGATDLTVKGNSTASDEEVSAIIEADAAKGTKCLGQVTEGRFTRPLPGNTVSATGRIYWQWRINGQVRAARWKATVSCRGARWHLSRSIGFPAAAGVGTGRASELFVPHSLKHGSLKARTGGQGGEGVLYPQGQCTWWVALLRPDLPWFPGEEGNAANWITAAKKRKIPTGSTPAVHAVAVFAPGQDGAGRFGHVAYVTAVDTGADTISISEANFEHKGALDTRTVPYLGLNFIYEGAAPTAGDKEENMKGGTEQPNPGKGEPGMTYAETAGSVISTWTDYMDGGGTPGEKIAAGQTVLISCKVTGLEVPDHDTWWYQIASPPWNGMYYASADAFYNDGATSGGLEGTPQVDPRVPTCG